MSGDSARPSRRALLRAALVPVAVALAPARVFAQDPRSTAVAAAARDWLALVDRGDTAGAYKAAGAKFRSTMASEAWGNALNSQRAPRGKLLQRSLAQTSFKAGLPGAPEGEYAVLLFRTSFEKAPDAGESLTLERDRDGVWRVVGYFIR